MMPHFSSGNDKKTALNKENGAASSRAQALLLGLAIGDALGVPVEFKRRGTFHVESMTGYGTHNQPPGTWSDDTSMALALADCLKADALDLNELARRFIEWRHDARYTPDGAVFDIGNATSAAIRRLKNGASPTEAGGREIYDNGNGSLMRIAPLVFYFRNQGPEERYFITGQVSSLTHAHPIATTACFIFIEMLNLIRKGCGKEEAYRKLQENFTAYKPFLDREALAHFDRILNNDIASLNESEIKSSGYVVDTLEAVMWSFLTTASYREAVLKAVNLGDDTDTSGAVAGALAGLHYGIEGIPEEWIKTLVKNGEIQKIANGIARSEDTEI